MRLVRQPRPAPAFCAAVHGAQDALGARKLSPQRSNRDTPLADAEEGPQIAVASLLKDDALRWELGRNSQRIAQGYGWRAIACQIFDLYTAAIAAREASGRIAVRA